MIDKMKNAVLAHIGSLCLGVEGVEFAVRGQRGKKRDYKYQFREVNCLVVYKDSDKYFCKIPANIMHRTDTFAIVPVPPFHRGLHMDSRYVLEQQRLAEELSLGREDPMILNTTVGLANVPTKDAKKSSIVKSMAMSLSKSNPIGVVVNIGEKGGAIDDVLVVELKKDGKIVATEESHETFAKRVGALSA